MFALLHHPLYQDPNSKYHNSMDNSLNELEEMFRPELDQWAAVQKSETGLKKTVARLEEAMIERTGRKGNQIILPLGAQTYCVEQSEKMMRPYNNRPLDVQSCLDAGSTQVFQSRSFRMGHHQPNMDPAFRNQSIGTFFPMTNRHLKDVEAPDYRTGQMDVVVYSESDDNWVKMEYKETAPYSGLFDGDFEDHRPESPLDITPVGKQCLLQYGTWGKLLTDVGVIEVVLDKVLDCLNDDAYTAFMKMIGYNTQKQVAAVNKTKPVAEVQAPTRAVPVQASDDDLFNAMQEHLRQMGAGANHELVATVNEMRKKMSAGHTYGNTFFQKLIEAVQKIAATPGITSDEMLMEVTLLSRELAFEVDKRDAEDNILDSARVSGWRFPEEESIATGNSNWKNTMDVVIPATQTTPAVASTAGSAHTNDIQPMVRIANGPAPTANPFPAWRSFAFASTRKVLFDFVGKSDDELEQGIAGFVVDVSTGAVAQTNPHKVRVLQFLIQVMSSWALRINSDPVEASRDIGMNKWVSSVLQLRKLNGFLAASRVQHMKGMACQQSMSQIASMLVDSVYKCLTAGTPEFVEGDAIASAIAAGNGVAYNTACSKAAQTVFGSMLKSGLVTPGKSMWEITSSTARLSDVTGKSKRSESTARAKARAFLVSIVPTDDATDAIAFEVWTSRLEDLYMLVEGGSASNVSTGKRITNGQWECLAILAQFLCSKNGEETIKTHLPDHDIYAVDLITELIQTVQTESDLISFRTWLAMMGPGGDAAAVVNSWIEDGKIIKQLCHLSQKRAGAIVAAHAHMARLNFAIPSATRVGTTPFKLYYDVLMAADLEIQAQVFIDTHPGYIPADIEAYANNAWDPTKNENVYMKALFRFAVDSLEKGNTTSDNWSDSINPAMQSTPGTQDAYNTFFRLCMLHQRTVTKNSRNPPVSIAAIFNKVRNVNANTNTAVLRDVYVDLRGAGLPAASIGSNATSTNKDGKLVRISRDTLRDFLCNSVSITSGKFWQFSMQHHIPVGIGCLVFRPHQLYEAGTIWYGMGHGECGSTFYGQKKKRHTCDQQKSNTI